MLNATSILEKVAGLVPHLFWIIAPREAKDLVLLRPSCSHSDPKCKMPSRKVLVIPKIFYSYN